MSTPADVASVYAAIVEGIGLRRGNDETGFQMAFARCESPIEQAFCLTMFQIPFVRAVVGEYYNGRSYSLVGLSPSIIVFPQQPFLQYRTD